MDELKEVPIEIEYYDMKNGVHCIGSFYNVTSLADLKVGDKVVSIEQNKHLLKHPDVNYRRRYWIGVGNTRLNKYISMTVSGFNPPYHVGVAGHGAYAFDLLYKERD